MATRKTKPASSRPSISAKDIGALMTLDGSPRTIEFNRDGTIKRIEPEITREEVMRKEMMRKKELSDEAESWGETVAVMEAVDNLFYPIQEVIEIEIAAARLPSIEDEIACQIYALAEALCAALQIKSDNKSRRFASKKAREAFSRVFDMVEEERWCHNCKKEEGETLDPWGGNFFLCRKCADKRAANVQGSQRTQ